MSAALDYYNRLQGVLPKEAASVIADVLHEAVEELRKRDLSDIHDIIRELAEAQKQTEARVEELAEAQKRTEARLDSLTARVEELAEAQKRTEARVEELAEAQKRTEARVEELAEAQRRTESSLDKLVEVVGRLIPRVDANSGALFEIRFRDRLPAYLGRYLRRAAVLSPDQILDLVEDRLPENEWHELLLADVIASGKREGGLLYLVCEVSLKANASDIDRASRRCALLAKAGLPSCALVACEEIDDIDRERAQSGGVLVWCDGSLI